MTATRHPSDHKDDGSGVFSTSHLGWSRRPLWSASSSRPRRLWGIVAGHAAWTFHAVVGLGIAVAARVCAATRVTQIMPAISIATT